MTTNLNSYRAQVVSNFIQGPVQHTTYVAGRTDEEARRTLEREGFDVVSMEVLMLSYDMQAAREAEAFAAMHGKHYDDRSAQDRAAIACIDARRAA